ncbi:MAG: hypothetical protein BA874_02795 [Desulfuromonadales bacterium C00003068]|nr:MAG: hypothetical protein BA874_02795 [Desulfuromonadales bacterium C00003068]
MSIQKKVATILLIVLVVVMGAATVIVNTQTSHLLHSQANDEKKLLTEAAHQQANSVFQSLVIGTSGSVETGDMDLFGELLTDLATVQNVSEVGMLGPQGSINYSSFESNIGRSLDSAIFQQAKNDHSGTVALHETSDHLILTRSQIYDASCLDCHEDNNVGDLGGVLYLKYDLASLQNTMLLVEQNLEAGISQGIKTMILTAIIGVLFAIAIIYWILGLLIRKPLVVIEEMFDNMAAGRFDGRLQMDRHDEIGHIGQTIDRFADFLQHDVLVSLQKLAQGDLSFDVNPRDQHDSLRIALKKVCDDLNDVLLRVQMGGTQIASGASQVSDSSQSLSEGATDSASSLEEISASMNELSSQTRTNAENSQQANTLASQARSAADRGNTQMRQMVTAMADINESGLNISKIIKVIDEIAFQTNLLALNAAVEAARAGQHGKGFAVVAEEVRNLAARSAKAAQETAALIESSVSKAEYGAEIADNTAEAFSSIVEEIQKVNDLVGEISSSSSEQAQGITQINDGISKIDEVTQQNTANAEEGAAAAEELSSQAAQLEDILKKFVLKNDGSFRLPSQIPSFSQPTSSVNSNSSSGWGGSSSSPVEQIALDDSEFGKF